MVHRCIVQIAIAMLVLLSGEPGARAQGAADPARLKPFDFMLGDVAYRILLPRHATLMGRAGSDRFHVSLSTRMMRQLRVSLALGEQAKTYPDMRTLPNGAVLRYEIIPPSEGITGSGGPESALQGWLQIGEHMLAITCLDQASWPGAPSPGWCIDYLHHLVVVPGN